MKELAIFRGNNRLVSPLLVKKTSNIRSTTLFKNGTVARDFFIEIEAISEYAISVVI